MQMRSSVSTSSAATSAYASSRSRLRTKPYGKRYGRNTGRNSVVGVVIGLLLTACVTGVYFLAIQEHDVELSFDQQLELERQTYRIANHSMYMARSSATDLISALSHEDWSKVSKRIDWVVFISISISSGAKIEERPSVEWTAKMSALFADFVPPNLGIILFPCGCVVPNKFVTLANVRFSGMECAMLPGFVFPHKYVAWTDAKPTKNHPAHCMHHAGWFARHEDKLEVARQGFDIFKEHVIAKHAEELMKRENERINNAIS